MYTLYTLYTKTSKQATKPTHEHLTPKPVETHCSRLMKHMQQYSCSTPICERHVNRTRVMTVQVPQSGFTLLYRLSL